ncbi:unnamed protein product [Phytomonas sp. Hart1]|nr:unnamed protein product [Phytomonas sp. Hart1]|eukprot:CCW67764.1 unnamed protein product [Phytomonas sp. isolate Hart1]
MDFDSDTQNLLAPLETISFAERWKVMVELGRRSMRPLSSGDDAASKNQLQGDRLIMALIAFASSEVHYERMLAGMAFRGMIAEALVQKRQPPSGVLTALRKLMLDPSSKIFKLVATPLVQISTDDALKEVLIQAPMKQFLMLNNAIQNSGKSHIMRELFNEQKQFNRTAQSEEEKMDVNLSAEKTAYKITSTKKMENLYPHLPEDELKSLPVNDLFALPERVFRRLTVLHPELMVEILMGLKTELNSENHILDNTGTEDIQSGDKKYILRELLDTKIFIAASALGVLSRKKEVDLGMKLIKDKLCISNLFKIGMSEVYSIYLRVRTLETCECIVQNKETFHHNIRSRRIIKRLQSNTPLLVEMYKMSLFNAELFHFLPKSARQQFYDDSIRYICVGNNNNVVPMNIARYIPSQALRENTAKRMFHLKDLQTSPNTQIEYLGLLPFHEAWELSQPFLKNPKQEIRRSCATALIHSVAYYPAYLSDLLAFILKQMNEQDQWRTEMFDSLTNLPLKIWKQEHLSYVDQLIQKNFEAKDVSEFTLMAAQKLLVRIAETFPVYASEKLHLFIERDIFSIEGLDKLSCSSVERFLPLLFPKIKDLILEEKNSIPNRIRYELNPRLRLLKNVLKPIYDFYLTLENPQRHSPALEFYYEAFRHEALHQIFPEILCTDATKLDRILGRVLFKHHQGTLLNTCLKFLRALPETDDESHFFTDQCIGFFDPQWAYRLTLTQQRTLAEILLRHYVKDNFSFYARGDFFELITSLPSLTIEDALWPYTRENYDDLWVRDTAVFALRRMHDAASLAELRSALRDSRARQAVLAITARLKSHPVPFVLDVVASALEGKTLIASEKHLVRFLGALADADALEFLIRRCENTPEMHEDVRLAMQDGLRSHLDQERVWEFYEKSVKSARSAECVAVLGIRDENLHYDWQVARMNGLLLPLLRKDDPVVQLEALRRLSGSPFLGNRAILSEVFGFLSHLQSTRMEYAMRYLLHNPHSTPAEVVERLANLKDDRDIAIAVKVLTGHSLQYTPSARTVRLERIADGLYKSLIAKRRQPTLIAKLVLFGSSDLLESRFTEMISQNLLHTGAACYVVGELPSYAIKSPLRVIQALERSFRQHAQPFFRRCGLAMLQGVASENKWPLECLEALQVYREDSDLWIQNDAALVLVPLFEQG